MNNRVSNIELAKVDGKVMFPKGRNFAGEMDRFGNSGVRSFTLSLDEEIGENLMADGWNVKKYTSQKDPQQKNYYLNIAVRFGQYPPHIYVVHEKSGVVTEITEDEVDELDSAAIVSFDAVIRPRYWGDDKIKAYLQSLAVIVAEDDKGNLLKLEEEVDPVVNNWADKVDKVPF